MNDYTSIYVYVYDKQPIFEGGFALTLEGTFHMRTYNDNASDHHSNHHENEYKHDNDNAILIALILKAFIPVHIRI
jgi:hypothetical protein